MSSHDHIQRLLRRASPEDSESLYELVAAIERAGLVEVVPPLVAFRRLLEAIRHAANMRLDADGGRYFLEPHGRDIGLSEKGGYVRWRLHDSKYNARYAIALDRPLDEWAPGNLDGLVAAVLEDVASIRAMIESQPPRYEYQSMREDLVDSIRQIVERHNDLPRLPPEVTMIGDAGVLERYHRDQEAMLLNDMVLGIEETHYRPTIYSRDAMPLVQPPARVRFIGDPTTSAPIESMRLSLDRHGVCVEGTIPIEDARAAGLFDGSASGLSIGARVVVGRAELDGTAAVGGGPARGQARRVDVTQRRIADG